jgi:putative thiamine transport system substrate-binding protein
MRLKMVRGMMILYFGLQNALMYAAVSWSDIEKKARGQSIDFSYWGESKNRQNYIDWVTQSVEQRYGVHIRKHPRGAINRNETLTDVFEVVDGGDFKRLKEQKVLLRVDHLLPNWIYLDTSLPIRLDHGEEVQGLEVPFEMPQLSFIRHFKSPEPSKDVHDFLRMAVESQGKITYPDGRYRSGLMFIKQALYELMPNPGMMQHPVNPQIFDGETKTLWDFLDRLHPYLWKQGKEFPKNNQAMQDLYEKGEFVLSMTNNPAKVGAFFHQGRKNVASNAYGHKAMVTNFSRVAIYAHSMSKEAALVLANFLISPQAQAKRADLAYGGMPSVLDPKTVPQVFQQSIASSRQGMSRGIPEAKPRWDNPLTKIWASHYKRSDPYQVMAIPEAHHSWDKALVEAWGQRYAQSSIFVNQ